MNNSINHRAFVLLLYFVHGSSFLKSAFIDHADSLRSLSLQKISSGFANLPRLFIPLQTVSFLSCNDLKRSTDICLFGLSNKNLHWLGFQALNRILPPKIKKKNTSFFSALCCRMFSKNYSDSRDLGSKNNQLHNNDSSPERTCDKTY